MKFFKPSFLLLALLCCVPPAWGDWMVISYSGEKPNRVALFANIESLSSSSDDLQRAAAMFRNDSVELARLQEQIRRFKSVRLVEVYESTEQPESRYYSVEFDADTNSFRTLDSCEFRRDGTFLDLTQLDWKPVGALTWSTVARKFVFEQEPWREAKRKLLERTRKEKKVTEQKELAGLGYELVHNHTDLEFPELLWTYVWKDGQKPATEDGDLVVSKIQYGLKLGSKENAARQKVLAKVQNQVQQTIGEKNKARGASDSGESALSSWVGAPETELVASWGTPDGFSERGGVRYLTYRKERVVDIMGAAPANSGLSVTKVGEDLQWAEVTFQVLEGSITEYNTKGNVPW